MSRAQDPLTREQREQALKDWWDAIKSAESALESLGSIIGDVHWSAPLPAAVERMGDLATFGAACLIDRPGSVAWLRWYWLDCGDHSRAYDCHVGGVKYSVTTLSDLLDVIDADHTLAEAEA